MICTVLRIRLAVFCEWLFDGVAYESKLFFEVQRHLDEVEAV